jgi:phage tail sheath gpL-like
MGIDVSARAAGLGVEAKFQNARAGSVVFLPQKLALFAQGQTGVTYPTTKFVATSLADVGAKVGFKCPAYLCARELLAQAGGIGSIPLTIYPLADEAGSTAATASVDVTGTLTKASPFKIRAGGVESAEFTLPQGAVSANYARGQIAEAMKAVSHFPYVVTYTYGALSAAALVGTGNGTIGTFSVTGTPRPGDWRLTNTQAVANGGVWQLSDPNGVVVATGLTQTVGVGAATVFNVAGIQFTVTDGTTDFGLGAYFVITVPATAIVMTSGWKGASANDLKLEVLGDLNGATFSFTQPSGGTINPDLTVAINQVGSSWETMILNALNPGDATNLNRLQTFGEGRWGALERKQLMAFVGENKPAMADAIAVPNARSADRVNVQLVAPGSPHLPCVIAAAQLAKIIVEANNNPATGYSGKSCASLVPGADSAQWNYPTRDFAMKAGCSTIEVVDGVVRLSDIVTMHHPSGEADPAYRYVVNIVKIQNIVYNVTRIFQGEEWASAPLLPDSQVTDNPKAKKPKSALAAVGRMIDQLALSAIIADPDAAKAGMTANINSQNPNRLDIRVPAYLSGNSEIKDAEILFSFYLGAAPLAA